AHGERGPVPSAGVAAAPDRGLPRPRGARSGIGSAGRTDLFDRPGRIGQTTNGFVRSAALRAFLAPLLALRHAEGGRGQYGVGMIGSEAVAVGDHDSAGNAGRGAVAPLLSLTALRFVAAFLVFGLHVHIMGLVDSVATGVVLEWMVGQGERG